MVASLVLSLILMTVPEHEVGLTLFVISNFVSLMNSFTFNKIPKNLKLKLNYMINELSLI